MCSRGFSCCWSQLTMVQALWPRKCLATFCCSWSKRERQTIKCPPQSIPNRQPRHRNLFLLPISLFIGFDKGWFTYIITKNHPPPNRFWRFSLLEKILNIALRILSVKGGKKCYHLVPSYKTLFSIPVPSQCIFESRLVPGKILGNTQIFGNYSISGTPNISDDPKYLVYPDMTGCLSYKGTPRFKKQ